MTSSQFEPVALPDSPYADAVQQHCLSLPGAWEDYPWGQVSYKVGKKMFAGFSGIPVDAENPLRLTVKADPHDADFLVELPHITRASHVGRFGWVTIAITDTATLAHARELIDASYALIAPKRRTPRL